MRRRFYALVAGLSPESMWRRVAGDDLAIVDDHDLIRAALRST